MNPLEEQHQETVEGTVKSVVYHNDENGYTVLHVEIPSEFELAKSPEITIVGKTQAVWEGEDVKAVGQWITDKGNPLERWMRAYPFQRVRRTVWNFGRTNPNGWVAAGRRRW